MQSKINVYPATTGESNVHRHALVTAIFLLLMAFLAIPVPFAQKAHAAMHGICAQRPSHTFSIGATHLPFDARMTGIYLGFFVTFLAMIVSKRHLRSGFPSIGSTLVAGALVGSMAIDGVNSLVTDLGLVTIYETTNTHRLITGTAAGTSLAMFLVMLLGMTLWSSSKTHERVVNRWWHLILLFGLGLGAAGLLVSSPGFMAIPISSVLMIAAVIAFSSLSLVTLILITGRENMYASFTDAQPMVVRGLVIGVAAILVLSGARFTIEAVTGMPPLI